MLKKLITGEYQPHLESALLGEVRRLRANDLFSSPIIVVPTNLLALYLSRLIAAELGGHAGLRFLTMLDLARRIAQRPLALKGLSAMPPMADQLILRQAIGESLNERASSYFRRVAQTDGFLRVFLEAVDDLKEGGLAPHDLLAGLERAKLGSVTEDKIREVVALWSAYEAGKTSAGFYDRADLMAEAAASAGVDAWLAAVPEIVIYGFYDLNPLQMSLVERCVSAKDTAFFFPYLDEPAFEYARPALEWLRSLGFAPAGGRAAAYEPGALLLPSGLRSLRAGLFSGAAADADGCDGVAVISAPGEIRESKEICRELLRLAGLKGSARKPSGEAGAAADDGQVPGESAGVVRLNEIGIVLREPTRYVGHLVRELSTLGVEPFVADGLSLGRSRAARSLLLLMELIESDFGRRQVMDFLSFAEIDFARFAASGPPGARRRGDARGRGDESGRGDARGESETAALGIGAVNPALWDLLSKEAGVVRGAESWTEKLSALRGRRRPPDEAEESPGGAREFADRDRRRAVGGLIVFIERLVASVRSLPARDTPGRLAEQTAALYETLIAQSPDRDRVIDAIQDLALLEGCAKSLERSFFFWLVRRHLDLAQSSIGSFQGGGPAVGGLMSARGLPFKVVVLPGLKEGWFPKAARQDPVLLDAERAALNRAFASAGIGGRLGLKSERYKEERLLFRLAVGAASSRVIFTFPRLDPLSGAEWTPSGFLLEAVEALTGKHCAPGSLDALASFSRVPLAQLFPADGVFLDQNEFDLSVANLALERGGPDAMRYLNARDNFFSRVIEAERCRRDRRRFTRYDAVMEAPEAVASLGGTYAGKSRVLSPTSLEDYAACPFLYFMRHILRIQPVEDPEEVLSISPRDRGGLAHQILEKAYREMISGGERPWPDWMECLRVKTAEVLNSYRRLSDFGLPLLWELEEERLLGDLLSCVRQDLDELNGFVPWKLELAYGLRRGEGSGEPCELILDDGRAVLLGGKIDRVDRDREAGKVKVIDYKTGSGADFKDDSLRGGRTLQLPIYVLGARRLFGSENEVDGAEYFFVSGKRKGDRVRFSAETVDGRMDDITTVVSTIVLGVEAGLFFAHPGDACRYCDYTMACGACWRFFERKKGDPRISGFLQMQEME